MKTTHFLSIVISIFIISSCTNNTKKATTAVENSSAKKTIALSSKLLLNLPETFNSPASGAIDKDGNVYFTSPNSHNDILIKSGDMKKPALPTIGKIDKNNNLTTWYTFKPEEMDKKSGVLAPFGIAFGPDSNLYVVDMQLWAGGESRIIRINIENGMPTSLETVLRGMSFPNAVAWKGNDLFITDTDLGQRKDGKQVSGVYKVSMSELNAENPITIQQYVDADNKDNHLFETFTSDASLKFGANGLTFDGEGNMYTAIMEEGSVLKTTMDEYNNKIETTAFAKGMLATDGMMWDSRTNKIYAADLFANAVYSIDMAGTLDLLVKNENTNGEGGLLDGPGEVVIRGNEVIVLNFDAAFGVPEMVNTTPDAPYTISVLEL